MPSAEHEEIRKKLGTLIESYKKRCLAYYLHFESSERKLPQAIKNTIKEKYGQEKFMPAPGWVDAFGENADSDILDNEIIAYLTLVDYTKEDFVIPRDRLKNMIWNNAREEGQKILTEIDANPK
jgi:hypothetical protein